MALDEVAAEAASGREGALEIYQRFSGAEICAAEGFLEEIEFEKACGGRGCDGEAATVYGDAVAFAGLGGNGRSADDEAGGDFAMTECADGAGGFDQSGEHEGSLNQREVGNHFEKDGAQEALQIGNE